MEQPPVESRSYFCCLSSYTIYSSILLLCINFLSCPSCHICTVTSWFPIFNCPQRASSRATPAFCGGLNLSLSKLEQQAFKIQPLWVCCVSSSAWLIARPFQAALNYFCIKHSLSSAGKLPTLWILNIFLSVGPGFVHPICSWRKNSYETQRKLSALISLFCLEGDIQLFFFVRSVLGRNHLRLRQEGMFQDVSPRPCSSVSKQFV